MTKTQLQNERNLAYYICGLKNSEKGGMIMVGEKYPKGKLFGTIINCVEEENIMKEFHDSLNQIYPKNGKDYVRLDFVPFYESFPPA